MIELVVMIVAVVLAHDQRDEIGHIWFDFCTCIECWYRDSDPLFASEWWDRRYEYLERSENGWTWFPGLSG